MPEALPRRVPAKAAARRVREKSPGERGKYAEGWAKRFFDIVSKQISGFSFNRVPDAHAAGGRFPAQAGDFQAFRRWALTIIKYSREVHIERSVNWIIEIKQTKEPNRLPYKNFEDDKVGRMYKRVLSGSIPVVAVCHGDDEDALWRIVPFDVFLTRNPETPYGSWDLRAYQPITATECRTQLRAILDQEPE